MRMDHLKKVMQAVQKTVPDNNPGSGILVYPEEVEEELTEVRDKTALIKRFEKYRRVDDLINDFTLDAAKRIIYEMEYGKTSNDRRSAAKEILDRGLGRPVDRVLNITAEVGQYSDEEVDSKIDGLLMELGYKELKASASKLLIEDAATPEETKVESG